MAKRRRINYDKLFRYDVSINDWSVNVSFNDYTILNMTDGDPFEERISIDMDGRVISTSSKKCKQDMAARITIEPGDFWYRNDRTKDDNTIGYLKIEKKDSEIFYEDTLYFWISLPTKSYENMKDYLTYKGSAQVGLIGTELFRRKGEIYYLGFGKLSS